MKKVLKITGIILLILLVLLFTAPFLFKGKIITLVKKELNEAITAKADFEDVSVSFFRNFPKVSVAVENLYITDVPGFENDTLLAAKNINAAVDFMSLIKGTTMKVSSVSADEARAKILINSEGKGNWDIMKPDEDTSTSEEPSSYHLELQKYTINNSYLYYYDSVSAMKAEIKNLHHTGSGDFTQDVFNLNTYTNAEGTYFSYGNMPYLSDVSLKAQADIVIDNNFDKYSFDTEEIYLNDLQLAASGYYQFLNDSVADMDIAFNAPSTAFKHILSLIPAIYQQDFEKINTSGTAKFDGFVKGEMDDNRIPSFRLNLAVQDGFFQYPDLPTPLKDIQFNLLVDNAGNTVDNTVIDLTSGHFEMGGDPFDFRFLVKNPTSAMYLDAEAKGKVDLGNITKMVKLEQGTSISGILNADIGIKGNVSAMQQQQISEINSRGTIGLNNFSFASADYPDPVNLNSLLLTFNPRNVTLNNAAGSFLGTGFSANGTINNLLEYALKDKALNGHINVVADKIDVNKFMNIVPDSTGTEEPDANAQPFLVPANLNMSLYANAGEVTYDNLVIHNLDGTLAINDQSIKLDNIKGNALDGAISISGMYSTKNDKKNPEINFVYNVQNVDVQKTFMAFNTVQKLMPLGKWLGGTINSSMVVSGKLGQTMMPVVQSLTGEGNLLLINGILEKFTPLEKLGERLKINELKNITLKDVRQYFEFTNGKVLVKPFTINFHNIEMEVGGLHGIDQSLDYNIHLKIPRAMLGSEANNIINGLVNQAASRGLTIQPGEFVNVQAKMLGTISNPDIQLNLKETTQTMSETIKEQVKDFAQEKIDSVKTAITDTLQSVKKQIVDEAAQKLKEELLKKTDTGKENSNQQSPAERAKGILKNILPKKDSTNKN